MIDPGIYPDLPERDYRSGEWAALPSWSSVGRCETASPMHARAAFQGSVTVSPAMRRGSAIHCALLEPDIYANRYVDEPEASKRSKAGKAEWDALESAGLIPVSADERAVIEACANAARDVLDREVPSWTMAMREVSVASEHYGILGKARLDIASPGEFVIDPKTTFDLTPNAIERACWNRGYAGQVCSYRAMLDAEASTDTPRVGLLWISTTAPHFAALTWLSEDYQRRGDKMARNAWSAWREATKTGVWAPPAIPTEINAPKWA